MRVQGLRARERGLRTLTCLRGHRQYLRSGPHYDFPGYRNTVHEVTQAFAAASREVLAVEAELAGPRAQPLLAGHVRSLQQLEQTRLATVRPRPLSYAVSVTGLICSLPPLRKEALVPVPHSFLGAPSPIPSCHTSKLPKSSLRDAPALPHVQPQFYFRFCS